MFYCSSASLEVKGPTEQILEGQDVTLECLDTESELNMSTVHFERFSKVRSLTHNGKEIYTNVHNVLWREFVCKCQENSRLKLNDTLFLMGNEKGLGYCCCLCTSSAVLQVWLLYKQKARDLQLQTYLSGTLTLKYPHNCSHDFVNNLIGQWQIKNNNIILNLFIWRSRLQLVFKQQEAVCVLVSFWELLFWV